MSTKKKENPYAENYRRARLSVVEALKRAGLAYEEHEPLGRGVLHFTVRDNDNAVTVRIGAADLGQYSYFRDWEAPEQVTVKATRVGGRYGDADKTITYKLNSGAGGNYYLKNEDRFAAGVKRQLQAKQEAKEHRAKAKERDDQRAEERASANAALKNAGIELGQEGPVTLRTSRFGTQKYDIHIEGLTVPEVIQILGKIQPVRVS